jgi:hypothetical protein
VYFDILLIRFASTEMKITMNEDFKKLLAFFKVFADESRLRMVGLLDAKLVWKRYLQN